MKVESADGVVHDFPDDTDPKVVDFAMKRYALNNFGGAPESGPHFDEFFTNHPVGRILDAFGQGVKSQWGGQDGISSWAEGVQKPLQDLGIYNDITRRQYNALSSFNEAWMRPAVTALQTLFMGVPTVLSGVAGAVRQTGKEVGLPGAGEFIAAAPEVLPSLIGVPIHLPPLIREAQRERIIGPQAPELPPPFRPIEGPAQGELPLPGFRRSVPVEAPPEVQGELPLEPPRPTEATPAELPEPLPPPRVSTLTEAPPIEAPVEPPTPLPRPTTPIEPISRATNHLDAEGRIRLDTLETVEDVNRAIEQKVPKVGEVEPPLVMIQDLADATGVNVEELAGKDHGPAEVVQAKIDLLTDSAEAIHDAAAKVKAGEDINAVMDFIKAKDRHWTIQDAVIGGEVAKVADEVEKLQSVPATSAPAGAPPAPAAPPIPVGGVVPTPGATPPPATPATPAAAAARLAQVAQQQQAIARGVAGLGNTLQVGAFIRNALKLNFADMAYEFWVNSLLAGLATHTTYAIGNVALLITHMAESGVAGVLGKLHGGPKVLLGEMPASLYGFIRGQGDGVMASWQALKSGITTGPFYFPQTKAIPGVAGQIIRTPVHMTAGIHSYARTIGYSQKSAELAYRDAAASFTPGTTAFQAEFDRLYANQTPANMQTAADFSSQIALMGQSGPAVEAIVRMVNQIPALKFLIPFARMSGNAVRQGLLERSPLGLALSSEIRANVLGRNGAVARDEQLARLAVGTAVGSALYGLAMQGLATGGAPTDPKEAALWKETGKIPYAVKFGNTWVSETRIGPLGLLLGAFANAHDVAHSYMSDDEIAKTAGLLMSSISHSLVDETWLRGPSDLLQAVHDPKGKGQNYINNQLATLVPFSSGLRQAVPAVDPYVREARTLLDTIKSRVPWWSTTLIPKYSIWGQPIPSREALGGAGVTALYTSKVNDDPVNLELERLHIFPATVPRHLENVELTGPQHEDLAKFAGLTAKQRLDILINSPGFSQIPDFAKRTMITGIIDGARAQAEALVKAQNPSILLRALEERRAQIGGALPKKNLQQK